ncbi:MAG: sigma-70 family RNA polymerase sigma factor [Eggerthellaceae bacterium]|nr:sigma-70 family RNA polymerase sigma factor [Eggerthellaceae bacterium]
MFGRSDNAAARLTRLFELYEQRMYRVAFAILHDEGQAEEAVMSAFEGIVRNGHVPRDPASKEAERLAFAAVRNAAIDQYRKNVRERQRTRPISDSESGIAASAEEEPERAAISRAGFDSLIDPLREPQQAVLRERFERGSSVREAADSLGISEAAVRKRQQRAIAQIRNLRGMTNE